MSSEALPHTFGTFRELLDLARDAIIVRDVDSHAILYWNQGAANLYGWTTEEAIGRRAPELLHTRFPEPFEAMTDELVRTGSWNGELERTTRDGRHVVVESRWTARTDVDGRSRVFVEVDTDVTERRQAETTLRMVVDNAPVLLFAIDSAGLFTLFEGQGVQALDLEPGAMVGRSIFEEYRSPPEILDHVREALAGRAVAFTSRTGNVTFDAHLAPLRDEQDRVIGVIGVATDVSPRIRAEEAEHAVRERDAFLSIAAHELRTPLTSLRGFAQLLLRRLDSAAALDGAAIHRLTGSIERQTQTLGALIDQLLDITRLDAGRLRLDRRETDLVPMVAEIVAAMRARVDGHRFVLNAPPTLNAWVDPLRLEQVVANLVDNAFQYSPKGTMIEVRLEAGMQAGDVRIVVQDQGIGVPPEHRPHIFDRFYRAHDNDYRSGFGLGLYISHEIVSLHGGRLEAEFPEAGGSRFMVSSPVGSPPIGP